MPSVIKYSLENICPGTRIGDCEVRYMSSHCPGQEVLSIILHIVAPCQNNHKFSILEEAFSPCFSQWL